MPESPKIQSYSNLEGGASSFLIQEGSHFPWQMPVCNTITKKKKKSFICLLRIVHTEFQQFHIGAMLLRNCFSGLSYSLLTTLHPISWGHSPGRMRQILIIMLSKSQFMHCYTKGRLPGARGGAIFSVWPSLDIILSLSKNNFFFSLHVHSVLAVVSTRDSLERCDLCWQEGGQAGRNYS